jgi:hypothetical protein
LWAVGTLLALVTIALLVALLVVNLDAVKWEDLLSRERIEQVALFIGMAVAVTTLIVLLAIGGASLGWTGFADKTLWEWLQLLGALAIPLVLAIAGFWFTTQQEAHQEKIEGLRAKSEKKIEEQRAQDAALQAYLDQMGTLLLTEELRKLEEDSEVRTLARARTLTVLGRLDPQRKTAVMQFLVEAELVQSIKDPNSVEGRGPIISLSGADLSGADLFGADLSGADMDSADLIGAKLIAADLSYTDLSATDLSWAQLNNTSLGDTNFRDANLGFANLSGAKGVTKEMLKQQAKSLRGAVMPDGIILPFRAATHVFEPPLSFILSDPWYWGPGADTTAELFIEGPEGGQLLFTRPLHVFDPTNPSDPKELPAPENTDEWVSWFQRHPNLDTSKPGPASVGGASGKQIDVTASSTPENYPRDLCGGEPCVPLYPIAGTHLGGDPSESRILSYEGYKDRFIILDVGGETVIIDVAAPEDKFDAFLPKAQKVLESVEWKGG